MLRNEKIESALLPARLSHVAQEVNFRSCESASVYRLYRLPGTTYPGILFHAHL